MIMIDDRFSESRRSLSVAMHHTKNNGRLRRNVEPLSVARNRTLINGRLNSGIEWSLRTDYACLSLKSSATITLRPTFLRSLHADGLIMTYRRT